jgi:hypothetical protein
MKTAAKLVALAGLLSLIGCGNKVHFDGFDNAQGVLSSPSSPTPEPPVIVPTPAPAPAPAPTPTPIPEPPKPLDLKSGACPAAPGTQVLSCLSCASTPAVIPPPLLSRKAQELLDIMTAGCAIHNGSDPKGYDAPTHDELLKRLIQCSPTAYQDTAFIGTQSWTINALLTNSSAQKAAFSGLYYNGASTDFETYFGLEIKEARYAFCFGGATLTADGVYPKEYYDSLIDGRPYTLPPAYVKAQKIRQQLKNCMADSLAHPDRTQAPTIPAVNCSYESAEGEMSQLVVDQFNSWKAQGLKVYFEGFNVCAEMTDANVFMENKGAPIKLAVKKCQ